VKKGQRGTEISIAEGETSWRIWGPIWGENGPWRLTGFLGRKKKTDTIWKKKKEFGKRNLNKGTHTKLENV